MTKLLGDRVALVDNEVLVEDLEDLVSLQVGHDGRRMPLARGAGSRGGKGLSSRDDDNGDDNYASLRAYDINDQPRHPSPPPSSHAHGTTLHDGIGNYHRPLTTAKTTATPPAAPGRPYSTLSPPAAAAIVGEPVLAETTTTSWPLRQPA